MATQIEHSISPQVSSRRSYPQRWFWAVLAVSVLAAILITLRFAGGDLLRARVESTLNDHLVGYTVRLPDLQLDVLGVGLRLMDVTVTQNAHPKPPVASFAVLALTVDWRALLRARLVADLELDTPRLHIDRRQLVAERNDETDLSERGWQDAVEAIYPLKINHFEVTDGSLTYIDADPERPLQLAEATIVAENIRNVRSAKGTYPSKVRMEAVLFDSGKLRIDGNADFLARPHAAIDADVELASIPLASLDPVADNVSVRVRDGVLSANGHVEYGPKTKDVLLRRARIDGVKVNYVQSPGNQPEEVERAEVAEETAEELSKQARTRLFIDQVELRGSELTYTAKAQGYRVFLSDTNVTVRDVSNRDQPKPASFEADALFMGQGTASLRGTYRAGTKTPELDLDLRIEDTPLTAMNDLFQAYGNFDVSSGTFSFYSEIRTKEGQLQGYVKPLFTDMDVYDRRQDRDESILNQAYEGVVGGVSKLLQNPRDDVAAKVDLSGRLDDPDISTWQTVLSLIQNAFFRAILPGFERQATKKQSRP